MTTPRGGPASLRTLARLWVERSFAGDAEVLAQLYEPDAVLGFPPGQATVGRDAIRAVYEQLLSKSQRPVPRFEEALPTLRWGDLALTGTYSADNVGVRSQVARRQPDGTWLRIIDRPEVPRQ
jgi:uncharacterized protein (TIGR02246 family)